MADKLLTDFSRTSQTFCILSEPFYPTIFALKRKCFLVEFISFSCSTLFEFPQGNSNQFHPYDYSSIMHYRGDSLSKGELNFETLDPSYQVTIGQHEDFSERDIKQTNDVFAKAR